LALLKGKLLRMRNLRDSSRELLLAAHDTLSLDFLFAQRIIPRARRSRRSENLWAAGSDGEPGATSIQSHFFTEPKDANYFIHEEPP
jgi:hypothetical protein